MGNQLTQIHLKGRVSLGGDILVEPSVVPLFRTQKEIRIHIAFQWEVLAVG